MALFTVEQLDIIRRLHTMGIGADAVVEALKLMDQVDADLDISAPKSTEVIVLEVPRRPLQPSNLVNQNRIDTLSDAKVQHGATRVSGEEACIEDTKQFITKYSLRQATVAAMTGVPQTSVSNLLNGSHQDLSLRCRRNIYCWYLNCRRHPEKLLAFLSHDTSTRLETNIDKQIVPQKRERFVVRPPLLNMLETYFREVPFPDAEDRLAITNACNRALQAEKKGGLLKPIEMASPQAIAHWFANKRKELGRRAEKGRTSHSEIPSTSSTPQASFKEPSPPIIYQSSNEKSTISKVVVSESSQSVSTLLNVLGSHAFSYLDNANLCNLLPNHSMPNATANPLMNMPMVQSLLAQLLPQAQNVPTSMPSVENNSCLTQTLLELLLSRPEVQGLVNPHAVDSHLNFLKTHG